MSTTSTRSRSSMSPPHSSANSRRAASRTVSPTSTAPPGMLHSPRRGSLPRCTRRTVLSLKAITPTPGMGRRGYSRDMGRSWKLEVGGWRLGHRALEGGSGRYAIRYLLSAICQPHVFDFQLEARFTVPDFGGKGVHNVHLLGRRIQERKHIFVAK